MKKFALIFFCLACCYLSIGQNTIGIPDIINYTKNLYNAGANNWDIVQDKNGIVYFANIDGLLTFDGTYWKTYYFPNKTSARSLAIGKDNKIYAGSQDDFGYFSPDKNGRLTFTSLKPLIPQKYRTFAGVWDIVPFDNSIFFRSESSIFQLNNGIVTAYPAITEWRFLGQSNNQVIAQDFKNGLLQFINGVWSPFVKENELPPGFLITGIIPLGKDSSLVTTIHDGLFILSGNRITRFKFSGPNPFANELILSCALVNKDWIAIGTQLNGCYIINKNGEIIQNFSRKEGLQNNCVLSLYLDRNQNLWLGLDNGVDFTAYNNAIKHVYPEQLNEGAGYSSIMYKNELYIGTSNRLYKIPASGKTDMSFLNGQFVPIPDTRGSVWGLYEVNGELLMAHHEGAMLVKNGAAISIDRHTGYWNFMPFNNVLPSSLIVGGNYTGLDFLQYNNGSFVYKGKLPNLKDAVRFAAIDNNNNIIWVAHTYRGVYKIDVSDITHPAVSLYTDKNGLPALRKQLFKVKNRIAIATEKGIYEYNAVSDRFELSAWFKNLFGQRNIRYLKEDTAGNIWFVEDKSPGVIDFSGPQPRTIYFPELNGRIVAGFEHINPIDNNNVLIGAEKGFYHINYEQYKKNRAQMQVRIGMVRAFGRSDSLIFAGYFGQVSDVTGQPKDAVPRIGNRWNSYHFEYSSPLNENQNSVEYSFLLKGFDKDWAAWSKKTEKDYTNLPAGTYTFQIKAKSHLGSESAVSSYSFTVLPPWYQTTWAYLLYALILGGIIYLVYARQRKIFREQQEKHEEEQKRLQYLHQLELEKSEKEIMRLKNEKLQAEVEHKNTELASVAMHLVQKGELLTKIKEELVRMKNGSNGSDHHANNGEFKKLIHTLNEEDKVDKDWEQFAVHFDKVHSDFLRTLKAAYPNLSAHELKLCAYLLMNLSSKEIAQLMNISVRGVEISRYRLRKKFQISTETNLFNFLMEFSTNPSLHTNGNGNGNGHSNGNGHANGNGQAIF